MAGGSTSFQAIPNNTAAQWWNDAGIRTSIIFCFGCMLCPFYLGYDQSLLTGLQAIPQWNSYFHSPAGNELGLIASAIFIPGVVAGIPAEWISERWGRKAVIFFGSFLIIVGGIFNALSQNRGQFIGSRVILGTGGTITKVGAPALLQELAHPRLRQPLGYMYYVSAIILFAPESPRYLVKKGREDEAIGILSKYHANGARDDPLVQWELAEIKDQIRAEEIAKKTSYLALVKTPADRHRLAVALSIGVGVNWVGNGIVSYYLVPALKAVGIKKPSQLTGINAGLAAWNLVLAQLAGMNIHKVGIRTAFLVSTAGMIISYAFVMGFNAGFAESHNKKTNLGIAAIPFLTPLNYSYVVEIFPYAQRTKALALYVSVQNMGNALNQWANPLALAKLTWKYYAIYIAVDCLYMLWIYFGFPESRNLQLEECGRLFDYPVRQANRLVREAVEEEMARKRVGATGETNSNNEAKQWEEKLE
ncbi:hexose transporter protein [Meredithblackwellia eburnea MCA 4105]